MKLVKFKRESVTRIDSLTCSMQPFYCIEVNGNFVVTDGWSNAEMFDKDSFECWFADYEVKNAG